MFLIYTFAQNIYCVYTFDTFDPPRKCFPDGIVSIIYLISIKKAIELCFVNVLRYI